MPAPISLALRYGVFALLACTSAAALGAGPAAVDLVLGPTATPPVELPPQALRGTGLSGDFNGRALQAHQIRLQLADGRVLRAERRRQVADPRLGESWSGEFSDAPGSLLVFTRYRGVVTGFFHHGADVYEIMPGSGGRQLVYQVDPARIPRDSEPLVPPLAGETGTPGDYGAGAAADTAASGIVQDLLVVYTPAAVSKAGSETTLQSQIMNAVAAANTAYANSQLGLTLNVVGLQLVDYTETGDMGQALSALRSPTDGKLDEVHALRDQVGADLVAMVNEDGNYCGIAYVMTSVSSSFAPYAFGVTARACLSNQTLAHEIGHNQGNQHDRETSGSSQGAHPYAYGLRRCVADSNAFRTVMSYQCTNGVNAKRVNNFSNPGVAYNGYSTGVSYETSPATSADNVRSMGNTAAVIAGFRAGAVDAPPAAPSGLSASAASASSVTLRWSDNAGDESGFEVWRSPDGVEANYAKVATLGANATAWTDNGLQSNTRYWWKLRSYNAAGSSAFTAAADATTFDSAPQAPSGVSATFAGSTASVTVGWTDGSSNETGFEVRRETQHTRKGTWGSAAIVGSTGANVTGLVDVPGSGTYRYSVRALNAGGASAWSAPSSAVQVTSGTSTKGGGKGRNKTR